MESPAFAWQDTSTRVPSPVPLADDIQPSIRALRDQIYAPLVREFRPSNATDDHPTPVITRVHRAPLPELPIGSAQTVAVGSIVSITPHMVAGSKGVYSEYRVAINSVLMNHSAWSGPTLDVIEIGGSAQTPDGMISQHLLTGVGKQVDVGKNYIIFLKYQAALQCFTFVKLWEIRDGRVVAVSDDDLLRVQSGKSTIDGRVQDDVVDQIRNMVRSDSAR